MARILVTYGWCRTAYVALTSLARCGHDVYVCSHLKPAMAGWSRFCAGSAIVADFVQFPDHFINDVALLVKRWSIDVILPCHEDSLTLRRHEKELPGNVKLACSTLPLLEQGVDKASLMMLAIAAGVDVPITRFPKDINEARQDALDIGFPVIIKLRRSNSAKGVAVVHDPEALRTVFNQAPFRLAASDEKAFPILQSFLAGSVVGACFLATKGRLVSCFGERYLRVKSHGMGTSTFREPFHSNALTSLMERLVAALEWDGIGHFDFIEDPFTEKLYLLEMNPRLWGALNLSFVNGHDYSSALVAHTLGASEFDAFFSDTSPPYKRSLWLVGEVIRFIDLLLSRKWRAGLDVPLEIMSSLRNTRYDDWHWHDPLPLAAELICYANGYFASGGNVNPESCQVANDSSYTRP